MDLTLHSAEERVSSEEIAQRQSIPSAFLTKIVARLAAADLVQTQRGVNGGIRLARPAGEITLLQVVEAIDGPITFNRCNRRPSECARDRTQVTTEPNRLAIPLFEVLPIARTSSKK